MNIYYTVGFCSGELIYMEVETRLYPVVEINLALWLGKKVG
jgi:hypothetical protein